jgi:hypothetical protein
MVDNWKRTGAAVEARYQFLAWLLQTVEKLSKNRQTHARRSYRVTAFDARGGRFRLGADPTNSFGDIGDDLLNDAREMRVALTKLGFEAIFGEDLDQQACENRDDDEARR